MKITLNFD